MVSQVATVVPTSSQQAPKGGRKKEIENSKTADGRIDTEQPHKPAKLRRGKEFSGSPLRRNGGRQYRGEKDSELLIR